jgi:predicted nuclease of predicted toxin-antitoxin system
LRYAFDQQRVLITIDKDFGELAILRGEQHCGIIRLMNTPLLRQPDVCLAVLERYATDIAASALITVEQTRVRVRLP